MHGLPFARIVAADFEYGTPNGGCPVPVCLVAKELHTGQLWRMWRDELYTSPPPFPTDKHTLFVAYAAQAELGCFLSLGWPLPERVLDLFAEFRVLTNGHKLELGNGLLSALQHHGIRSITKDAKKSGRDLALQGHWTADEREELLTYCQTDVDALGPLLARMLPAILARPNGLGQALIRGRRTAAIARMEATGIPIDVPLLGEVREHWEGIKLDLIHDVDQHYDVFEGTTFKHDRFDTFLRINGIPWPRHDSGKLKLDSDTFKDRTRANPQLTALRELRASLSELRLEKLAVGDDGRNRVQLWPFSASTGRNAPSTNQFVFGPARWIRGLIKPGPGNALAYLDWSSQEIAIAAVLSGDRALLRAALADDPYLMFAKLAGLAPANATKATHKQVRALCKVCLLGTGYGMGVARLAQDAGVSLIQAEAIRRALAKTFPVFWRWAEHMTDVGMLTGELHTVFGWPLHVTATTKATTVRNFSMQANAAEMLGIACSLATERGVTVCAPIHDALLIEAPTGDLDHAVAQTRAAMSEASRVVLDGVTVAVGVDSVTWPGRYMDEDGAAMYAKVMELLQRQRMAA